MTPADAPNRRRDEFYIGYDPPMPVHMAARVRRVATATASMAVALAVTATVTHHRLAEATFE
jgi:hypothetical protein